MSSKALIAIATVAVIIVAAFAVVAYDPGKFFNNNDGDKVTVVDDLGREVTLNKDPQRIVVPTYESVSAFVAIDGIGFLDKVVLGLDLLEVSVPGLYNSLLNVYPEIKDIPKVGASMEEGLGNLENIVSAEPDLIIITTSSYYYGFYGEGFMETMEAASIPVVCVDFFSDLYKVEENGEYSCVKNIRLVGKILDQEERAEEIAEFFLGVVGAVLDDPPSNPDMDSFYVDIMWRKMAYGSYGTTAISLSEIDLLGGYNVARDVPGAYEGQAEVTFEDIYAFNADALILAFSSFFTDNVNSMDVMGYGKNTSDAELKAEVDKYITTQGLSTLRAYTEGNVYMVDSSLKSCIEGVVVLQYLAKWMYPEEYADLDPGALLIEYYDRFMPFDFDGVFFYEYN